MSVQVVERAFAVLRALSRGPMGVTELAEAVELPKSTVSRLLGSLEAEGAIEQVELGGAYQIGALLGELSGAYTDTTSLAASARPHLAELMEATGETAGISVVDGATMFFLAQVEAESDIQVRDWTGEGAPIHAVPSGIVAMANMPRRRVRALLGEELEQCTPSTVVDRDALVERLTQARSLGYAWGQEEFVVGLNSVAAPVLGADGSITAALHVHGPSYRFPNPDRLHDIGIAVAEAAERLAEQLQR